MFSAFARWVYRLAGWKLIGPVPDIPKGIWTLAPHNSNWDFLVGVGARAETRIWIRYLAKKELFKWYSGWFFVALGGKPVDRSRATNMVDVVVDVLQQTDRLHICITPEGTRSNVQKLKTGFYYIALKSGVPLILVGVDYPRKSVILSEPMYMTGDFETDMRPIYAFFSSIQGKRKDWLKRYEETGIIG
ncbi:1-acyl-sn-glycerol-3-phosphate acyltransferase [Larkinella soli]|uniref:1-acyl-sn-glycerol-3-phosphate acyltransferase n=1 Tax=Larkinella soli TaxID=1770527 RepID=UPI000FFBC091|nr:1-acyl-sn-glycerol-3-phosphate acyltransferase [Larkinella soli]